MLPFSPQMTTPQTLPSPLPPPLQWMKDRGWRWGGRKLQAGLQGKCLWDEAGSFVLRVTLTHIHRHTSECSLTGVRKQSKLLHGDSNHPWSQPTKETDTAAPVCPEKYHLHCLPPQTHTHTKNTNKQEWELPLVELRPYWGRKNRTQINPGASNRSVRGSGSHRIPEPLWTRVVITLLLV